MKDRIVRFQPAQELILEKLIQAGIYKTRSEAIRAGIIELGKSYNVFADIKELHAEVIAFKKTRPESNKTAEMKTKKSSENPRPGVS